MENIVEIISQVGFPIAVCLISFLYINKLQSEHKSEMSEMSKAINNNTLVMQKLIDSLERGAK